MAVHANREPVGSLARTVSVAATVVRVTGPAAKVSVRGSGVSSITIDITAVAVQAEVRHVGSSSGVGELDAATGYGYFGIGVNSAQKELVVASVGTGRSNRVT